MLPSQTWSQCIDEILAPDITYDDYASSIDATLESFGYAQCQIERWIVGGDMPEQPITDSPPQEQLVCYGTVCSFDFPNLMPLKPCFSKRMK